MTILQLFELYPNYQLTLEEYKMYDNKALHTIEKRKVTNIQCNLKQYKELLNTFCLGADYNITNNDEMTFTILIITDRKLIHIVAENKLNL